MRPRQAHPPRRPALRRLSEPDVATISGGAACLIAGVVLLVLASSFLSMIVGACLLGLAGIAFVSLVFLMVGESEDRGHRKGA
ncbi:MAG TPA: hypothetical protein VHW67_05025 [Solirubrobacteraceae bacterium]|nr:hypothetical protein [Solirubrobacteraceae bacterium]